MADCIPEVLRAWFASHLSACLDQQAPISYHYECSSARVFRLFNQTVYPVGGKQGFLVVNTLIRQEPHDPVKRPARESDEAHFLDGLGRAYQCSNCRRVMHHQHNGAYHWLPDWVDKPRAQVEHSLCLNCCIEYHCPGE